MTVSVRRVRDVVAVGLPPVLFGLLLVLGWEWWANRYDIKPFVIPKPSAIWEQFVEGIHLVRAACFVTGFNALFGLVAGVALGVAVSVATNRFRVVAEIVNPLAVTVAAIPAVVIVGVLNNMFDTTGQTGRRIMVTLAVFFIVFVQVSRGLRQNDATQLELMRSYAARPRQVLLKVRVPNMLPFLFTAIRTAAPIAVIIALVSEYFGGPQDGLGSKISGTLNSSNKALGFAYVLGGSIVGLLFFAGSSLLEYVVVPWQRRRTTR
jgi:NitT/TauT family transport system permease protein